MKKSLINILEGNEQMYASEYKIVVHHKSDESIDKIVIRAIR